MTPRQLPLALGPVVSYHGADFLIADSNRAAVAWLERWPAWPAPALVLHGPAGCGKTHLLRLFAQRTPGARLDPLSGGGPEDVAAALDGARVVLVDDAAARIASLGETSALHLYNMAREAGRSLLLADRAPPSQWPIALPDLGSRLNAAAAVAIGPPDDALLAALLVKHFRDRQLSVDPEVIEFLVNRIERSAASAARAVAALDAAALGQRRRVTIRLAREWLGAAVEGG